VVAVGIPDLSMRNIRDNKIYKTNNNGKSNDELY
jgi:hypothetical protein